jgi:hypothetical protein
MILIQKRSVGTWSLVTAICLVLAVPAWAAGDAVSVHRGAAVTGPAAGQGGVRVDRGHAAPSTPKAEAIALPVALEVVGGQSLWFIDTDANKLTACVTRRSTQVGRDYIRCTTRGLPVH